MSFDALISPGNGIRRDLSLFEGFHSFMVGFAKKLGKSNVKREHEKKGKNKKREV